MTHLKDWDPVSAAFRIARKRGADEALDLAEKLIRKWAECDRSFAERAVIRWVLIKAVLYTLTNPASGVH